MAFNPFHRFRKHQKVIFAGLTILCMLTFVLAGAFGSRGGDFFGWLQGMVGSRSATAEATVYGKEYSGPDIGRLKVQRLIANQFMKAALETAHNNFFSELLSGTKYRDLRTKLAEEMRKVQLMQMMQSRNLPRQLLDQLFNAPLGETEIFRYILQIGPEQRPMLERLRAEREAEQKKDEANLLGQYIVVLDQLARLHRSKEFYFGGTAELDNLADFLIWQHQANLLGINLTPEEIRQEFKRETLDRCPKEAVNEIAKALSNQYPKLNPETLYAALGDEFRVRLAQIALGYDTPPSMGTPYEFWQYFREQRTESPVAVLKIPVRDADGKLDPDLAKRVDALPPPTEEELIALFNKYKNDEGTGKPGDLGFKHPRRVQVEWVSARPDSSHYRKQAEQTAALLRSLAPAAFEARLLAEYGRYRSDVPAWRQLSFPLNDTGALRREQVAAVLGQVLGTAGTRGPILPVITSAVVQARVEDAPRVRVGGSWLLAGASGSPFAALGIAFPPTPQELDLSAVKGKLLEKIDQDLAEELVKETLDKLKDEIKKKRALPADAVKKYGLESGATDRLHNSLDIARAKGLERFQQAYLKQYPGDTKGAGFGALFFHASPAYTPEEWPPSRFGLDKSQESFLYWNTKDEPAKAPESITDERDGVKARPVPVLGASAVGLLSAPLGQGALAAAGGLFPATTQVRDKVVAAWRYLKARELAKKEAEELAEQVEAQRDNPLSALKASPVFKRNPLANPEDFLKPVARLTKKAPGFHDFSVYEEYQVPPDKIAATGLNTKFGKELVDKLLSLKEKGDAAVLSDEAEENYYVAALTRERQGPSMEEFHEIYTLAPTLARFRTGDPLVRQWQEGMRTKHREELLKRLRTDAKLWINPDYKKSDRGVSLDD
jgi:hypothetical protein